MAFEGKAEAPAGVMPDRAQPHDPAVERAVLAAMLREPEPCVDIAIEHLRSPEVFYSHVHREIFRVIVELNSKPHRHAGSSSGVDLVTVAHQLQSEGKLEAVGGELFLAELVGSIATTVNLEAWCVILRNYATLRRMIDVCSESLLKCYNTDAEAVHLVEEIETDIYNIRHEEETSQIVEIQSAIKGEFQTLRDILDGKVEVGIPTGFAQLDSYTGGLKPGEMFVLAARPLSSLTVRTGRRCSCCAFTPSGSFCPLKSATWCCGQKVRAGWRSSVWK